MRKHNLLRLMTALILLSATVPLLSVLARPESAGSHYQTTAAERLNPVAVKTGMQFNSIEFFDDKVPLEAQSVLTRLKSLASGTPW